MEERTSARLIHGWCFSSAMWKSWKDFLNAGCDERGYTEKKRFAAPSAQTLITFSQGLHFIDGVENVQLLVIIAGFERFPYPHLLPLMKKKILENFDDFHSRFMKNCFSPLPCPQLTPHPCRNLERILQDLDLLEKPLDLSPLLKIPQILILHGKKDRCIPASCAIRLHQALPQSHLVLFEEGPHALPMTHPKQCWLEIRRVSDNLCKI